MKVNIWILPVSDKKGTFWKVSIFSSLSILKAPCVQTSSCSRRREVIYFCLSSASHYTAALTPLQYFNQTREERNATNYLELILSAGLKANGRELPCRSCSLRKISLGLIQILLIEIFSGRCEAVFKAVCVLHLFSKQAIDQEEGAGLSLPALHSSPLPLWGSRLFPPHPRLDWTSKPWNRDCLVLFKLNGSHEQLFAFERIIILSQILHSAFLSVSVPMQTSLKWPSFFSFLIKWMFYLCFVDVTLNST